MAIDFDNIVIPFNCPECGFSNTIKISQIKLSEIIICSGCYKNIRINDEDASLKRSTEKIQKSIEELTKSINRLNR